MFLPIRPIIDKRPRRNGTSLISIQYCYSSDRRTLLYQKMIRIVEDIVTFSLEQKVEDPMAFLKMTFVPDFDTSTLPQQVRQLTEHELMKSSPTWISFTSWMTILRPRLARSAPV
jgi:hypothetical protein